MSAFEADDAAALVDIPGIASLDSLFQEGLPAFAFNPIQDSTGASSSQLHVRSNSATSSTDHLLQEEAARSNSLVPAVFLPRISWPASETFSDSPSGSPRCLPLADDGSNLAAAGSSELASEQQMGSQDLGGTVAEEPTAAAAQQPRPRERRRRQQTTFTTSKLAKQREKNRRCQRSFRERQKVKQSAIMQELSELRKRNAYLEAQLALHIK